MKSKEEIQEEYKAWKKIQDDIPESAPKHIKTTIGARISLFRWVLEIE